MKIRKVVAAGLICLLALSGCGQTEAEKPDLSSLGKIKVIVREEGSGTRTQFESLLNTEEGGASKVVSSTEDVLKEVENDPSAIGYMAMSALSDKANVKAISINGTTPSEQSVQKKKYALSRGYYLAWLGDQSDLEREFITYARGAGQKFVAEEAVPVAKETTFLSLKPAGTLKISGSTSMTPLVKKLAEDYEKYNPNARVTVEESDSAQGLLDAMQSKTDLAMSSRDLKDYEKNILNYREIASDGIVIVVNSRNKLANLKTSEVKDIFDGKISKWGDV